MGKTLTIGMLARDTGVKVPTIRFYEQIGLLGTAERTASNRRVYGTDALRRLKFIRHARELGFAVDAIRQLLALADHSEKSCAEVDAIAKAHLEEIESRLARLRSLKIEIGRMLKDCGRGQVGECRIIEVLADHKHCLHVEH
ncbi:MAG: helix-turn-helix domain-containing protein [Hyphomicrobiaceae bacterium]